MFRYLSLRKLLVLLNNICFTSESAGAETFDSCISICSILETSSGCPTLVLSIIWKREVRMILGPASLRADSFENPCFVVVWISHFARNPVYVLPSFEFLSLAPLLVLPKLLLALFYHGFRMKQLSKLFCFLC